MKLTLAWGTDPGLQREENEDCVLVWEAKAGVDALLVVCDGMGGHAAGHLASSIATETFAATLARDGGLGPDLERLRTATAEANTAVNTAARENPAWNGMGSTLVAAAVSGERMGIVNVGDSPAWLHREGLPTLVSQDHSWPAEQVRLGIISPEEAVDHPMKHRLTRAIGIWGHIPAYVNTIVLRPGDLVVLCSDGVETAGVEVDEMIDLLAQGDLQDGVRRVIDRCRELGAPDNVTVAAAWVAQDDPEATVTIRTVTPEDTFKTAVLPAPRNHPAGG